MQIFMKTKQTNDYIYGGKTLRGVKLIKRNYDKHFEKLISLRNSIYYLPKPFLAIDPISFLLKKTHKIGAMALNWLRKN